MNVNVFANGRSCVRKGMVALILSWMIVLTGAGASSAADSGAAGAENSSGPSAAPGAPAVDASAAMVVPAKQEAEVLSAAGARPAEAPRADPAFLPAAARTGRFAQASPDFAFGRPRFSVAFRGLQQRARADSAFHRFVQENFFVRDDPADDPLNPDAGQMNFDATGIGLDVGFGISSRLDARVGIDYTLVRALTEDRFNEDSFGLPIEQTTESSQLGIQGDVTFALTPRGRQIGQYVWIPSAVIPYVGAGGRFVRYGVQLQGDFVDVLDFSIFPDTITAKGWAPSVHVLGGVDFRLTRNVLLTTEARYAWAAAELDGALTGFDLDLTGLRISAGVRFVF